MIQKTYCLRLLKNERACSELSNYFDDDNAIDYLFKRLLESNEKGTTNRSNNFSSNNENFDSIISILGKIRSDHESLKGWIEKLKDDLKTAKYWLLLLATIWVAKYFFN